MMNNENDNTLTPAEETPKTEEAPAEKAPETKPAAKRQKTSGKGKGAIGIVIAVIAIVALIVLIVADGAKKAKAEAEAEAAAVAAEAEIEAAEAPEAAASEAETETDETAAAPAIDYDAVYAKFAPDAVVYTMNGTPVLWRDYYCWLYSVIGQLTNNYGITDWTMVLDESSGLTVADYILDYAEGMSSQYVLVHNKADELDLKLNDADLETIAELTQADADSYYDGDIDALYEYLASNYYTPEYYDYMTATSLLYEKIFAQFYGAGGEKLSESDVRAFLDEHGYFHAKHILLKTTDDSNAALDEEAAAAKRAQAEELLAQLKALPAEELGAKFDEMIQEYGEDPGALSYPNGYYFQSGQMVQEFESAAAALSEGELSDIVESSFGYHILYCPEMHSDDLFDYDANGLPVSVQYAVADTLLNNTMSDWVAETEIVYAPDFENPDLYALFGVN